ncbi:MAG TPA: MFS transporter, partial [Pseudomonadales bacterium]|nr:MFS transporter [Pseudomonadales bacterium]
MSPIEKRATATLVSLFALRMIGLFLLMPVFAVLGETLDGATPALIGLAIGIYGLTQCVVQVPFGVMSDRWGRKPVIVFGLGLFAVGGLIAAMSHNIWGVIIGRGIQGAGAISAAVMALLADLTREENRTKAMAMVGLSIGLSFIGALVLGPVLGGLVGLQGVFWITALLAVLGVPVCIWVVPTPVLSGVHRDTKAVPSLLKNVAKDSQLLRLNFGVFVLHMVMTSCFMMVPIALTKDVGVDIQHQWEVYLPALLVSFFVMVP